MGLFNGMVSFANREFTAAIAAEYAKRGMLEGVVGDVKFIPHKVISAISLDRFDIHHSRLNKDTPLIAIMEKVANGKYEPVMGNLSSLPYRSLASKGGGLTDLFLACQDIPDDIRPEIKGRFKLATPYSFIKLMEGFVVNGGFLFQITYVDGSVKKCGVAESDAITRLIQANLEGDRSGLFDRPSFGMFAETEPSYPTSVFEDKPVIGDEDSLDELWSQYKQAELDLKEATKVLARIKDLLERTERLPEGEYHRKPTPMMDLPTPAFGEIFKAVEKRTVKMSVDTIKVGEVELKRDYDAEHVGYTSSCMRLCPDKVVSPLAVQEAYFDTDTDGDIRVYVCFTDATSGVFKYTYSGYALEELMAATSELFADLMSKINLSGSMLTRRYPGSVLIGDLHHISEDAVEERALHPIIPGVRSLGWTTRHIDDDSHREVMYVVVKFRDFSSAVYYRELKPGEGANILTVLGERKDSPAIRGYAYNSTVGLPARNAGNWEIREFATRLVSTYRHVADGKDTKITKLTLPLDSHSVRKLHFKAKRGWDNYYLFTEYSTGAMVVGRLTGNKLTIRSVTDSKSFIETSTHSELPDSEDVVGKHLAKVWAK